MFFLLLILFTIVPLLELTLLIKLGQTLGLLPTIALVLGTGMLGAALARWQGVRAWLRVQSQLANGVLPAAEVTDGLLILAAGLLLITPGALSDLAGLALLLPPIRSLVRRGLVRWFRKRSGASSSNQAGLGQAGFGQAGLGDNQRDSVVNAPVFEVRIFEDE